MCNQVGKFHINVKLQTKPQQNKNFGCGKLQNDRIGICSGCGRACNGKCRTFG